MWASPAHWCVFDGFWTAAQLCGTEEEDKWGFERHTVLDGDTFTVGVRVLPDVPFNKCNKYISETEGGERQTE